MYRGLKSCNLHTLELFSFNVAVLQAPLGKYRLLNCRNMLRTAFFPFCNRLSFSTYCRFLVVNKGIESLGSQRVFDNGGMVDNYS